MGNSLFGFLNKLASGKAEEEKAPAKAAGAEEEAAEDDDSHDEPEGDADSNDGAEGDADTGDDSETTSEEKDEGGEEEPEAKAAFAMNHAEFKALASQAGEAFAGHAMAEGMSLAEAKDACIAMLKDEVISLHAEVADRDARLAQVAVSGADESATASVEDKADGKDAEVANFERKGLSKGTAGFAASIGTRG